MIFSCLTFIDKTFDWSVNIIKAQGEQIVAFLFGTERMHKSYNCNLNFLCFIGVYATLCNLLLFIWDVLRGYKLPFKDKLPFQVSTINILAWSDVQSLISVGY